ncbi:probable inactive receptor kinase [Tanacetum coccineum]
MRMTSSARVFLLVITLLLFRASSDQLEQDKNALISFITQVKKPPNSKYNWDPSQNPCTWPGVVCAADNFSVVNLRMPGASLVGKIPPSTIGKITSLRVLSLHDNGLSGPFPDDFADLTQLSHVYLHKNNFSGQFPSSLTHWMLLEILDLSDNNFSGRLPDNVASSSSKLVNFTVSNNNLSGPIPSSLARFPDTAFSGNFELCDDKKKKKRLSTGYIVAIAVGSAFIFLISSLCLGKKWSRAVKDKKAQGVATMAAADAAKAREAGTSSSTGASMEASVEVLGKGSVGDYGCFETEKDVVFKACSEAISSCVQRFKGHIVIVKYVNVDIWSVVMNFDGGDEQRQHEDSLSSDDKKKKKRLSTGYIVAIAIGSAFIFLISSLCLGKKWSRAVKDKKARGVATMAATDAAKAGEAGTSSSKEDVTGASMEASVEVLGKGSVGTWYKKVLQEGTTVVLKRLKDVVLVVKPFRVVFRENPNNIDSDKRASDLECGDELRRW